MKKRKNIRRKRRRSKKWRENDALVNQWNCKSDTVVKKTSGYAIIEWGKKCENEAKLETNIVKEKNFCGDIKLRFSLHRLWVSVNLCARLVYKTRFKTNQIQNIRLWMIACDLCAIFVDYTSYRHWSCFFAALVGWKEWTMNFEIAIPNLRVFIKDLPDNNRK